MNHALFRDVWPSKTWRSTLSTFFCGCCLLLLSACQSTVHVPPVPLPDLVVGIATFTQPTRTEELLAGYVPSSQVIVGQDQRIRLDARLRELLGATKRSYIFLTHPQVGALQASEDSQGRRSALAMWVQEAKTAGVDILLVPHIIDWRERVGGAGGVTTPAAVTVDFFLIDARDEGTLLQRSHFAEEQTSLASNVLSLGSFFKRKAQWLTAEELAMEGMTRAIQEFGL